MKATADKNDKFIMLVTHKDDCKWIIKHSLRALDVLPGIRPSIALFSSMEIRECAVATDVEPCVAAWQASGVLPALIIIDTRVHASLSVGASDGAVALSLIDLFKQALPGVPVIVVTMVQIDGLAVQIVKRNNLALVDLFSDYTNLELTFANALTSLVEPGASARRRMTVEIGEKAARCRISEGNIESVNEEYAYRAPRELDSIVSATNRFTPYESDHRPRKEWLDEMLDLGNRLYLSPLIAETIGPHITGLLSATSVSPDATAQNLDIRFEINVNPDETAKLFGLPFELVNPGTHNFLCTRIPMARRIRICDDFGSHIARQLDSSPSQRAGPLHILFIDASFDGTVTFQHEGTGQLTEPMPVNALENTKEELAALRRIIKKSRGRTLAISRNLGGKSRSPVGVKLKDCIQSALVTGGYDVLHFSGHSVTLPDNGGTFLVFPDRNGRGLPVSVREFAGWMRMGHCRVAVLSSCSGSSLRTAIETMRHGAEAVIGFRWDVNDAVCVDYFKAFYRALALDQRSFSEAYLDACRAVEASARGTPLWASAVAVVRD